MVAHPSLMKAVDYLHRITSIPENVDIANDLRKKNWFVCINWSSLDQIIKTWRQNNSFLVCADDGKSGTSVILHELQQSAAAIRHRNSKCFAACSGISPCYIHLNIHCLIKRLTVARRNLILETVRSGDQWTDVSKFASLNRLTGYIQLASNHSHRTDSIIDNPPIIYCCIYSRISN